MGYSKTGAENIQDEHIVSESKKTPKLNIINGAMSKGDRGQLNSSQWPKLEQLQQQNKVVLG